MMDGPDLGPSLVSYLVLICYPISRRFMFKGFICSGGISTAFWGLAFWVGPANGLSGSLNVNGDGIGLMALVVTQRLRFLFFRIAFTPIKGTSVHDWDPIPGECFI